MRPFLIAALATAAMPAGAYAQSTTSGSVTLYELPAYLGRSVTITADTPDLAAQTFAARAQSARVTGSWQVCGAKDYAGTCRTLAANQPYLTKSTAVSLRPSANATGGGTTGATATAATTAGGATAAIALDDLDADAGTEGQDVTFYARPALGGKQISAGSNDVTSATAFCKLAGAASAQSAGRARVQASGLIDVSTRTTGRAYPLRDVVCRK